MKSYPEKCSLLRLGAFAIFGLALLWTWRPISAGPPQAGFVPPGMSRLTVAVIDSDSGEPLEARVSFNTPGGEYYPPMGHPRKIPGGPFGGDLSLPNGRDYAYVPGEFQVELPQGEIDVEASRGFEYEVFRQRVNPLVFSTGKMEIRLKRWINMETRGWYPGDTHIHFPNPAAAMTEMKAEGLRLTNLLVYKSGVGDGEFARV